MSDFGLLTLLILVIFAVLNIVLFFKVWAMTNNVKYILEFLLFKSGYVLEDTYPGSGTKTFKDEEELKQDPDGTRYWQKEEATGDEGSEKNSEGKSS
ncbi:MAG: hypothetical protein CMQ40_04220 [Gammaproteobacteria bacterium]|nr:hypothetical protein [Gammaproteobacteria bacterium]